MFIRQNDTGTIRIGRFVDVTDGATPETTIALGTADSAYAVLGDDTEVDISLYTWTHRTNQPGMYDLTLQTGITDTVGMIEICIHDTSVCLPVVNRFYVIEEEVYDALYASGAAGFQAGPTLAVPPNTTKPPLNPTLEEAMMYVYWRLVYGKITQSTTEETAFADNGTTELWTKAITDSGGIVTYAEAAAGT